MMTVSVGMWLASLKNYVEAIAVTSWLQAVKYWWTNTKTQVGIIYTSEQINIKVEV